MTGRCLPRRRAPRRWCSKAAVEFRNAVGQQCSALGTDLARSDDFVIAANEIAREQPPPRWRSGSYALWHDDDVLYCEVRDGGEITDPLVGRVRPSMRPDSGRGVWIANQLCDLVQIRTGPTGTVVRLHLKR